MSHQYIWQPSLGRAPTLRVKDYSGPTLAVAVLVPIAVEAENLPTADIEAVTADIAQQLSILARRQQVLDSGGSTW